MAGKIFVKSSKVKFNTRWFKYDRDYLCVNKSQFVDILWALLDFLCAERQTKEALLEPALH
jgi:hypothetical protein